jgi:hypothetical protein
MLIHVLVGPEGQDDSYLLSYRTKKISLLSGKLQNLNTWIYPPTARSVRLTADFVLQFCVSDRCHPVLRTTRLRPLDRIRRSVAFTFAF